MGFYTKEQAAHENIIRIGKDLETKNSDYNRILEEIRQKHTKISLWDKFLVISIICGIWYPFAFFGLLAVPILFFLDRQRKTIRLTYEIDEDNEKRIQAFYDAFEELRKCKMVWNVYIANRSMLKRSHTSIFNGIPPYFKTNIKVPRISFTSAKVGVRPKRKTIFFFPDKILLIDGNDIEFANYDDLVIDYKNSGYVEDGVVPADAVVIDRITKNSNKYGEMDNRLKFGKEYPVCNYTTINFNSESGLHERLQFSKPDMGKGLAAAFNTFVSGKNG